MFGSEMTLADLSLCCELANLNAVGYKFAEEGYPKTQEWLHRMLADRPMKEITDEPLETLKEMTGAKL